MRSHFHVSKSRIQMSTNISIFTNTRQLTLTKLDDTAVGKITNLRGTKTHELYVQQGVVNNPMQ